MNERIKELADRLWRVHPSDIDAVGLKTRTEFYEHELKKFAKLIVMECAEICRRQQYYDADDEHKRGVNGGSITCMNAIKREFRVE